MGGLRRFSLLEHEGLSRTRRAQPTACRTEDQEQPMRRNLQAMRDRHAARELREELAGLAFGQGGWTSLYARTREVPRPKRHATHEELAQLVARRPGTPD